MNEGLPQNTPRVAIHTLGCKLNQAESELLAEDFLQLGYHPVMLEEKADIYVLNTCTVTHVADRKARHLLRLARRRHPKSLIVATGCYTQRAPGELEAMGVVDLVVPQLEKPKLAVRLAELLPLSNPTSHISSPFPLGRTRSYIKIQDGCHGSCAYCVVPQVRVREHSLPPDGIIAQVKARIGQGYREVVLTGTKIGSYHWDGLDLSGLVTHILQETGIERLRLSSLQPQEITPELLSLWANPRLCRHLHMPLQSGSDTILTSMRRRYQADDFLRAVEMVREVAPDIAITTDIMVGFPGESEADFQATLDFCQQVGFAAIHIFPYSPRPYTLAAGMIPAVDARVIKDRGQRLRKLAQQSARTYRERFLGTTRPVLWEAEIAPGMWSGLTDNYLRVFTHSQHVSSQLANQFSLVHLVGLNDSGFWGEMAPQSLIFTIG